MRRISCAALAFASALFASPALAQQTKVSILTDTTAGLPSHGQRIECVAVYWVALTHNRLTEPDRAAMMSWVNHLTSTEHKIQADLTPEITAKRDSLSISLEDPNDPNKAKPILDRCASFERRAPAAG